MKLLITGGAGFIGSHLCERYIKEGHTVICFDNFSNGNLFNIRHLLPYNRFKLIKGDIRDVSDIERTITNVDCVFHLAAQIHVDTALIEPKLTYETNILGTLNILETARRYDVEKIIYASTSEVYGTAQYAPMKEKHPLDATHFYGVSKIAADKMCNAYIENYGMNIAIMRCFNTYGPKQKDTGYGGAISLFAKRVLQGIPPIIYGDGSQSRDYTYIDDIVEAYDKVFDHPTKLRTPINFGTGSDTKIIDLAHMILDICGVKELTPIHIEPRLGEVQQLIADTTLAQELFNWKAQYDIDSGLRKYIEWYKSYKSETWRKIT